jgi:hypothetical protein
VGSDGETERRWGVMESDGEGEETVRNDGEEWGDGEEMMRCV